MSIVSVVMDSYFFCKIKSKFEQQSILNFMYYRTKYKKSNNNIYKYRYIAIDMLVFIFIHNL